MSEARDERTADEIDLHKDLLRMAARFCRHREDIGALVARALADRQTQHVSPDRDMLLRELFGVMRRIVLASNLGQTGNRHGKNRRICS
ncbi:hypothetical protein BJF93_14100 [Xaviernesmea oryzae]|uniref:Uncharacterized protein n=1 Tax=Xaviernesmea oryzae TaxID=464029 RepID=A0A1Q9ARC8_9HYPH|nr:hypothetical protein BJF93_14100 [Xaviernesmea oryzae]SEL28923.1 hypothetical protein SAMN04487976_10743 [Xaviernesmea oryzae]